jgi:hypothetical protein
MNVLVRAVAVLLLGIVAFFHPPQHNKLESTTDLNLPNKWDLVTQVSDEPVPPMEVFLESLTFTGGEGVIGIFVPGTLAMSVVQQPEGDPQYVSQREDAVTQYGLASQYGTTGLLAHSHSGGSRFHLLDRGQLIYLISGDESVQIYVVTEILHYQALSPGSFSSDFLPLDSPGDRISAEDLFFQIYADREGMVLQTCFTVDGILNWGRLFVIAYPYDTRWLELLGFGY